MLIIRLQRTGKKNQADFRIVLAEKESHVSKKFQEILGAYNPRRKAFSVREDRLKYWLEQRVSMSPTVHNLLVDKGFVKSAKVKAFNTPKKAAETPAAEAKPAAAPAPEAKTEEVAAAPVEEKAAESTEAPAAEQA